MDRKHKEQAGAIAAAEAAEAQMAAVSANAREAQEVGEDAAAADGEVRKTRALAEEKVGEEAEEGGEPPP